MPTTSATRSSFPATMTTAGPRPAGCSARSWAMTQPTTLASMESLRAFLLENRSWQRASRRLHIPQAGHWSTESDVFRRAHLPQPVRHRGRGRTVARAASRHLLRAGRAPSPSTRSTNRHAILRGGKQARTAGARCCRSGPNPMNVPRPVGTPDHRLPACLTGPGQHSTPRLDGRGRPRPGSGCGAAGQHGQSQPDAWPPRRRSLPQWSPQGPADRPPNCYARQGSGT